MKSGDMVFHRADSGHIQIGQVSGAAEVSPRGSPATYFRPVRWLATVDRGLLSERARNELSDSGAIFEVGAETSAELRRLADPWSPLVAWIDALVGCDEFQSWEIDDRRTLCERLRKVRESVVGQSLEPTGLRLAFGSPYNFTNFRTHQPFLEVDRIGAGSSRCRAAGTMGGERGRAGTRCTLRFGHPGSRPWPGTTHHPRLVSALRERHGAHPIYRTEAFNWFFDRLSVSRPAEAPAERYEAAITLIDRIIREARARGVDIPDRTHTQAAMWLIFKGLLPESFSEVQRLALAEFRAGRNLALTI